VFTLSGYEYTLGTWLGLALFSSTIYARCSNEQNKRFELLKKALV